MRAPVIAWILVACLGGTVLAQEAGAKPGRDTVAAEDPALDVALGLQDAFARVAERVFPSVVGIRTFVREKKKTARKRADEDSWVVGTRSRYPGFRQIGSGSGLIVSTDGFVLTCRHVLLRPDGGTVDAVDVELWNGRYVLSRVVATEPTVNLAVLQLEVVRDVEALDLQPATIGDNNAVRVGYWALALGNPSGAERTFSAGVVSALADRQCYQDQLTATYLQAAVDIHPEAYGGPLVDIHGRVVGLTMPKTLDVTEPMRGAEFALPIDLVMNLYQALKVKESTRSPWLGIAVLEMASLRKRWKEGFRTVFPRTGVFIDNVFDSSPASKAGIEVGDFLVALDGHRLFSVLDFQKWLYLTGIGSQVEMELFRDGESLKKTVVIEERPPNAATR